MPATYERKDWIDEAVQYPERYTMQSLQQGMVNLTPSPGTVDTVGTPQSAVNFNHIERGILDANIAVSLLALHLQQFKDTFTDETMPEVGTATLTNTLKLPFNNSLKTISLSKNRKTMNYAVEILSAVSSDATPVGDITVSNRLLNGFGLAYSGSAASVTIKYKITGGITV